MNTKPKNKIGRPTDYNPELAKEICDVIASSSAGIKRLCKENSSWPSYNTIYRWLANYPEFRDQYAQAKKCQVELLVDELLDIADDNSNDCIVDAEGQPHFNNQAIHRARLRIDTRKWLACKLVPKVYGLQKVDDNVASPSLLERLVLNI